MAKIMKIEIGQKFNDLTFVKFTGVKSNKAKIGLFKCDCGNEKEMIVTLVYNSRSKTCGCGGPRATKARNFARRSPTPTLSFTSPVVGVRGTMKSRCYNPNNNDYKNYGGRGIQVCDEWRYSLQYFHDWCMSNGWQKGLQIDRIDVNGDYEPSNCRFVTNKVNANNKRNSLTYEYMCLNLPIEVLAKMAKVSRSGFWLRMEKYNMNVYDAVTIQKYKVREINKSFKNISFK